MKIIIEATVTIRDDGDLPTTGDFGEWLRKERAVRGLSMKSLSQVSGVSYSHICRVEKGERVPTYNIIRKLRMALAQTALKEGEQ